MYKKKIFPFLFFSEDIERVYLICTGFIKYSIIEVYIIKIRKNKSTDEIDQLFESDNAEKLSPYLSIVKYKDMWVARDTTDYTPDCCIETEILFVNKPDEDLFYKVAEMVENIY